MARVLYLITEDWAFLSHRLTAAQAVRDAGHEVVVATNVQEHGQTILEQGFRLVPIRPLRAGNGPVGELAKLIQITALFRRLKPDIVHNFTIKPILFGSVAGWLAGVPHVINSFTGMGYLFISTSWKSRLLRGFVGVVLRYFHRRRNFHLTVQNPDDEATLRQYGIAHGRPILTIAGAGVDADHYRPLPEPEGQPIAALVGRMLWDKGTGELVGAAERLRERGCPLRIVLVGLPDPANPASIPEDTLRRWDEAGLVSWWGHARDVRTVWAQAHIAVLPSYREGLPKSMLEAAACGRPLVVTDVPGCREVVEPGNNGLLVTVRDVETLADALQYLASDPKARRQMGANARALIERKFTKERIADRVLEIYHALLQGRDPDPA
ncbi:MAG: glycosyltransferase family 4 protein [Alphaproteobacteria bacterium]